MPLPAGATKGVKPDVRVFDFAAQREVLPALLHHLQCLVAPSLPESVSQFPQFSPGNSPLLSVLRMACENLHCRTILAESYISTDYADEFGSCYSRVFREIPRSCTRLHFFADFGKALRRAMLFALPEEAKKAYLGYSVIRPIPAFRVGDTVLKSPWTVDGADLVHCQADFRVHLFGEELSVRGMPFIQQETHVGVCAQADLWMVARYMNRLGETRRYRPSELTALATSYLSMGSTREGLNPMQIVEALRQMGLNPHLVFPEKASETLEILYSYCESELPVIVLVPNHVMVVIGHDYRKAVPRDLNSSTLAPAVNAFYVHDDSVGPYKRFAVDKLKERERQFLTLSDKPVEGMIVIAPPRVHMRPEDVILHGQEWIRNIREWALRMPRAKEEDVWPSESLASLVFRLYLRRGDAFKREIMNCARSGAINPAIAARYWCIPLPKYVWVLEMSRRSESERCPPCKRLVRGEIVLDSTANRYAIDDALLACHLDGRLYWRRENKIHPVYAFEGPFEEGPRPPLLRPAPSSDAPRSM